MKAVTANVYKLPGRMEAPAVTMTCDRFINRSGTSGGSDKGQDPDAKVAEPAQKTPSLARPGGLERGCGYIHVLV